MSRVLSSPLALIGIATGSVAGWIAGKHCVEKRENRELDKAQKEACLNRFAVMDMAFEKSALKKALREADSYFSLMTALAAVGAAAVHEKGGSVEEVKAKLMVYLAGSGYHFFPNEVLESIEKLVQNPPSVSDALAAGKQFAKVHRQFFEETASGMIPVFGTEPQKAPDAKI